MVPLTILAALACAMPVPAVAQLYRARDLQGPVRAAGGDLLQLSGAGLSPASPVRMRELDGGAELEVPVVFEASDARALVLRMPPQLRTDRRYAIEVGAPEDPTFRVSLNDPRPAWYLPRRMPRSGASAGLARTLKIVGRNLAATGPRSVRLRGSATVIIAAEGAGAGREYLDEFVLRVHVPEGLAPGDYEVAVARGTDPWVILDTPLRIEEHAAPLSRLRVDDARFGGCRAGDGRDDTACVVTALRAAARALPAMVYFPTGEWLLEPPAEADRWDGIVIPAGVRLAGDVTNRSVIRRGAGWQSLRDAPLMTLTGDNQVAHLDFVTNARPDDLGGAAHLQVGRLWHRVDSSARAVAERIVITDNLFQGTPLGIRSGGLAARELTITRNRFRARRLGLALGGDSRNTHGTFRIEDAIVADNVFEPGSYLDAALAQGTRASELGAGRRVDFSGNRADGLATAGLDGPRDARGWRAAFFWHLLGPQEQLLIADNEVSCSGDKAGDGEAISLDNNHNSFGFDAARAVLAADATSVAVPGALNGRQAARAIDTEQFYVGHWLQIAEGPGAGQSRRIAGVRFERGSGRSILEVSPAWDVIPTTSSRVTVARSYWQTLIVGNRIEHRAPPCAKSNRTAARGGAISIWGQTTDSVVAFNRQQDTSGIWFQQLYGGRSTMFQYFLEIRGNEILGDYDSRQVQGRGGIRGSHGAGPEHAPPVTGFGIVIARNRIERPANAPGSAIGMPATWYRGPAPHRWPLIERPLVFGNVIAGGNIGIEIAPEALLARAVLADNTCRTRRSAPRPSPAQTVRLCDGGANAICGCDR